MVDHFMYFLSSLLLAVASLVLKRMGCKYMYVYRHMHGCMCVWACVDRYTNF